MKHVDKSESRVKGVKGVKEVISGTVHFTQTPLTWSRTSTHWVVSVVSENTRPGTTAYWYWPCWPVLTSYLLNYF